MWVFYFLVLKKSQPLKIYHNPRCRKSREALQYLQALELEYEVVLYLKNTLNPDELKALLEKLGYTPEMLLRKNESLWKTEFANKNLSAAELITTMTSNPKLIERPIVEQENSAVVARPLERLQEFLNRH